MKENFPLGVKITLGLEGDGAYTNDPDDPGGETKYGVAKRYHPDLDIRSLTLEQAMDLYYREYWEPAGCNEAPFPMDLCLFDSQVNPQNDPRLPGGGNREIIGQGPENWQDYQLLRMNRYRVCSKAKYVMGHINRVLILSEKIRLEIQRRKK